MLQFVHHSQRHDEIAIVTQYTSSLAGNCKSIIYNNYIYHIKIEYLVFFLINKALAFGITSIVEKLII